MPANVDSMFSVREMPWHGEGRILGDYPGTWAEARTAAGLDWEPVKEAQYRLVGMDGDQPKFEIVEDFVYITRSDTGKILDSANSSYELIGHAEMGQVVEALLEQPNVRYETAGALDEGRKVWALAQLGDPIELPGDNSPTLRYLFLANAHDGTSAFKAIGTGVRVVCANTWHAADVEATKAGTAYSFKHTKQWKRNIEDAKNAITGVYRHMDLYVAQAKQLLTVKVNSAQIEQFVNDFAIERTLENVNVRRNDLAAYIRDNARVANSLGECKAQLKAVISSATCAELAPTAYMLVQAAGEYTDHLRGYRSMDTYLSRTMIDTQKLKQRATKLALAYA